MPVRYQEAKKYYLETVLSMSASFTFYLLKFLCLFAAITFHWTTSHGQLVTAQGSDRRNCTKLRNTQLAYVGWPYRLSCHKYFDFIYDLNEDETNEDSDYEYHETIEVECIISDPVTGEKLLHKIGDYEETEKWFINIRNNQVSSNSTSYVVESVIPSYNVCRSHSVMINITRDPIENCEDFVNTTLPIWFRSRPSRAITMQCVVPKDVYPKLHLKKKRKNYSVQWLHTCSNLPADVEQHKSKSFDLLIIPAADYNHPGVYTCAVTYKGRTRYLAQYKLCLKPRPANSPPRISCKHSLVPVNIGQNVTLECVGSFGFGVVEEISFNTAWSKTGVSNFTCTNRKDRTEVIASRGTTHSCTSAIDNSPECISYPTSEFERNNIPATVKMRLNLRNVQQGDLGKYTITLDKVSEAQVEAYIVVQLSQIPTLQSRTLVVGICVGFAILVIFAVAVLYWMRFYVTAYAKKWCGSYEEEIKPYGAFLSYHFSTEIDVFGQQQTRDACAAIRAELESSGYKIYDERKDGHDGLRAENSITLMAKSHRVLIILTESYVNDSWSVFQLQQGFQSMISSGSKMIFVLVPGMNAHIKQHALTNDTYRMIHRAIKLNTAIEWSNHKNFNKKLFGLKLLHAMPKLRLDVTERPLSTISENGKHPNGLDRLQSSTTTTTEVFSDGQDATKL